jgi:hypothetical protein
LYHATVRGDGGPASARATAAGDGCGRVLAVEFFRPPLPAAAALACHRPTVAAHRRVIAAGVCVRMLPASASSIAIDTTCHRDLGRSDVISGRRHSSEDYGTLTLVT